MKGRMDEWTDGRMDPISGPKRGSAICERISSMKLPVIAHVNIILYTGIFLRVVLFACSLVPSLPVRKSGRGPGIIGASLSEPHTSVTVLRTRVSIYLSTYLSMDRPLTLNFKLAPSNISQ